jgi:hypothetical protein
MAESTVYRSYTSDEAKAKAYNRRFMQADRKFDDWKEDAEKAWHRYENLPTASKTTATGHQVSVTQGTAVIDALYSSLTAVDIDILVNNIAAGTPEQADLATAALAKEWELAHVVARGNEGVKDSLIASVGAIRVDYEYVETTSEVPRKDEDIESDISELLSEAAAAGGDGPDAATILSLVPVSEAVKNVLRDRIVVDYVSYENLRWDPTAKRIADIRWMCEIVYLPLHEVKENPAFRQYVKRTRGNLQKLKDLKPDTYLDSKYRGESTRKPEEEDGKVTVLRFTDLETGTVCFLVKGQDWLLNEVANPFALNLELEDRNPYVMLTLRKSGRRVRGVSEFDVMQTALKERDVYRSKRATYVERAVPKLMGPEDGLTDVGKKALESREYMKLVEIATGHTKDEFDPLQPPSLPLEMFELDDRIEREINDATGANEMDRGQFPDRKRTATETSTVVSKSAQRQSEKRNALEAFWVAIANRMLQLMQMFYDQERMVRYDSTFNEVEWTWTAEDIQMEYALTISLTPREEQTRQSRLEEGLALLNYFGPYAMPGPDGKASVQRDGLMQVVARKFGLTADERRLMFTDPAEQQQQELAAQQAAAGQASAAQGLPRPDMTTGPLGPEAVAAATNQGAIPPEVAAAAFGTAPGSPEAVEQLSESAGVRTMQ